MLSVLEANRIVDSMSLINISLFRVSISSCVSFGKLPLSRNWLISSRLSNLPAWSCSYYSLSFSVCEICSDVSFLTLVICALPLSLSLLAWLETYDFFFFFYLFKEPASGFIDFLYWFPFFNLIDFCSNFCYFFSLANFGFNLPFFCFPKTEAYIMDFKLSSFLIYAFNTIHFFLSTAFAGFHTTW